MAPSLYHFGITFGLVRYLVLLDVMDAEQHAVVDDVVLPEEVAVVVHLVEEVLALQWVYA